MNDKWEFYQDPQNLWRWRRTASNGKIVGSSLQGYVNKSDCIDNARRNGSNRYFFQLDTQKRLIFCIFAKKYYGRI